VRVVDLAADRERLPALLGPGDTFGDRSLTERTEWPFTLRDAPANADDEDGTSRHRRSAEPVSSDWHAEKSLDAARLTTQLFEEQLNGQTARYEVGLSTDFELLRYQRDLVDARVRELRALVDLQQAMTALQKSTDSLLGANGVDLNRP
jgi:hypothetical protein